MAKRPEIPKPKPITFGDDVINVAKYLSEDYSDISLASEELPALIEYINEKVFEYQQSKLEIQDRLERLESKAFLNIKYEGGWSQLGYDGKPTEAAIKMAVSLDARVKRSKEKLARHIALVARLKSLMDTLYIKVELIRSAESTRRKVFDDDVSSGS